MSSDNTNASPSSLSRRALNHPFTKPTADVKLVAADGVEFRVHSIILAEASPFFETLFSLPQPSLADRGQREDIPVIACTETSIVLDHLLRICYPIEAPVVDNLDDIGDVLQAAIKYDVLLAANIMKKHAMEYMHDNPVRVYSIACSNHIEEMAREAAQAALQIPFDRLLITDHVKGLTAGEHSRLIRFHLSSGEVPSNFLFCSSSHSTTTSLDTPLVMDDTPTAHDDFPTDRVLMSLHLSLFKTVPTDVVLLSSDHVKFSAHRAVLMISSSVLEQLLTSTIPSGCSCSVDAEADRHLVHLPESSSTIELLLRLCYAGRSRDAIAIEDVPEAMLFAAVAQQYKINIDPLLPTISALVDTDPIRSYFLAQLHKMDIYAIQAARTIVCSRLGPLGSWDQWKGVQEMENVPALAHVHILLYRVRVYRRCTKTTTTTDHQVIANVIQCTPCVKKLDTTNPCWWRRERWESALKEYMSKRKPAILSTKLFDPVAVYGNAVEQLVSNNELCSSCREPKALARLMEVAEILTEAAEKRFLDVSE